jgi:hypothetical protein
MAGEDEYRHLKGWIRRLAAIDPAEPPWLDRLSHASAQTGRAESKAGSASLAGVGDFAGLNDQLGDDVSEEIFQHLSESWRLSCDPALW